MFGNSPDETAYCRLYLNRETVGDAMTMIQPQLLSYGMGLPPEPVLLDVSSIQVCFMHCHLTHEILFVQADHRAFVKHGMLARC